MEGEQGQLLQDKGIADICKSAAAAAKSSGGGGNDGGGERQGGSPDPSRKTPPRKYYYSNGPLAGGVFDRMLSDLGQESPLNVSLFNPNKQDRQVQLWIGSPGTYV